VNLVVLTFAGLAVEVGLVLVQIGLHVRRSRTQLSIVLVRRPEGQIVAARLSAQAGTALADVSVVSEGEPSH
jgi:hypothetical protein